MAGTAGTAKREVAESSFDFLHYSIVNTISRCVRGCGVLRRGAWRRRECCGAQLLLRLAHDASTCYSEQPYIYRHIRMYVCMCIHMYMYMYMHIYMHAYLYLNVYVHVYA